MPSTPLESLYKRVGPTLFARAQRALNDDEKAQALVQQVVIELSKLGNLTDEEALKLGRDLLKKQLEKRGTALDSLGPGND
ncbi:MAG: hypothetical protein JNK82_38530 [Myxococcaceae bacterium]|nr:hypothetical protein [Myxococcaceae bacterium]